MFFFKFVHKKWAYASQFCFCLWSDLPFVRLVVIKKEFNFEKMILFQKQICKNSRNVDECSLLKKKCICLFRFNRQLTLYYGVKNIWISTYWQIDENGLAFENKVLISGEILKIFTIFLSLIHQTVLSVVFSLSIFWEEICISQEISISFVNVFDHCFESKVRNKKQEHRCVNNYVKSKQKTFETYY